MSDYREDALLPERLAPEISGLWLFRGRIHYYKSIDSTNTQARIKAEQGAAEGSLFIAEAQSQGRGRAGRSWFSQPGEGIYVSLLLRPGGDPLRMPLLTLLTAVAVVEAVSSVMRAEDGEPTPAAPPGVLDIKWPNDLLLNGRKLGGILSEAAILGDRVRYVVIGLGLNVHHAHFPPPLANGATSLFIETGRHFSRVKLLAGILKSFETWYNQFLSLRFDSIITRWSALSTYANGRRIAVERDGELVSGVTRGLDACGALRLERDDGTIESVLAGDIFIKG